MQNTDIWTICKEWLNLIKYQGKSSKIMLKIYLHRSWVTQPPVSDSEIVFVAVAAARHCCDCRPPPRKDCSAVNRAGGGSGRSSCGAKSGKGPPDWSGLRIDRRSPGLSADQGHDLQKITVSNYWNRIYTHCKLTRNISALWVKSDS